MDGVLVRCSRGGGDGLPAAPDVDLVLVGDSPAVDLPRAGGDGDVDSCAAIDGGRNGGGGGVDVVAALVGIPVRTLHTVTWVRGLRGA